MDVSTSTVVIARTAPIELQTGRLLEMRAHCRSGCNANYKMKGLPSIHVLYRRMALPAELVPDHRPVHGGFHAPD